MLRKVGVIFVVLSATACASPSKESDKGISIPCEVQNEYGAIGCGTVPLSLKEDVSQKFKEVCPIDLETDPDRTLACLKENKDNPVEAYRLGNLEFYGHHVEQNIQNGLELIQFSVGNNYPEAMLWLAKFYEAQKEYNKSLTLIKDAAELGNPLAMYSLGFRYSKGIGVTANKELAFKWLNMSKDYVPASYTEMATLYFESGDVEKFIEYNEKARSKKYWFADVELAILALGQVSGYENYQDLKKAEKYAQELITNKVAVGYAIKAQTLSMMSNNKPNAEICSLYKKAFDGGYHSAGINLGAEYLTGDNCDVDFSKALSIFDNLYKNTDGDVKVLAAVNLGTIYLNGLGVTRDLNKSKEYLQYAANVGYPPAIDMLNSLN
ncbi:SEL1-like repeat protein [Acinetobacter haemolyticus]|uniref:SEL1-like repeat protein n=1 Tax=Acinetobacter haemolyticus TaxID=29430 RepID=UPI002DBA3973|nr:SEL1-like repeat protein [Acinetobacter haemolyticus]MEB6677410.1 SEL1-like repeat protein [Acinetobacter haemolyticus]